MALIAGFESALALAGVIRSLSGMLANWTQSQGLTKEQFATMAAERDKRLGDFIETELALLDKKKS